MRLLALWMSLAAAAEPAWVKTIPVVGASGPPATECAGSASVGSPGVKGGGGGGGSDTFDLSTALRYDTSPNATNSQLPPEIQARLQLGKPYDLSALPLEALQGKAIDRERLARALQDAKARTVRVSFWGASHVAADFFTGEIRRALQDRYGDAGHGFVMPAPPQPGYRHQDINLCSQGAWVSDYDRRPSGRGDGRLGVGGASVESASPESWGWVQTTRTNPHGRSVSRFEVLYDQQPAGGTLSLTVDAARPILLSTKGAAGPGAVVLPVPDGPHRLQLQPAGDGLVRVFGVIMERDTPGVVVDSMGITGRTASSWLRWDASLMQAYLSRRTPDVFVLAYGTNEANDASLTPERYRQQLRDVLTRARTWMPTSACVLVGPSDRGKKQSDTAAIIWPTTSWVAAVQREIAPEFGCLSWDLQAATGGPGSALRWRGLQPPMMEPDLLHFTAAGYRELGQRFVRALPL